MALPDLFVERLRAIVPEVQFERVLRTFHQPKRTSFRVNTLREDVETALRSLSREGIEVEPVRGVKGAYAVEASTRDALLRSMQARENRLYVQNASSQLPPLILDPNPGDRVLDLCAAPGSKTRQMACFMQDEGELVAVEKVRSRFFKLKANIEQQGARCVRPVLANGAAYWHREPESFDRVLVDAPCSTEGRFRAEDPETTRYWSLRKIREMQSKQRKLLFSGIQALKPGGVLVYSTCSFSPEENEIVLSKALKTFGDALEVLPVTLEGVGCVLQKGLAEWNGRAMNADVRNALRVLPDEVFDGFFVAQLRKCRSTIQEQKK
ncbi:MAG: RsmB/NOP family class I SAM-dependent RNA methyltransferase [Rubricoccaceae bacterium]|nr:RsmB/NOP family class I SAM-dependent RNA methyltransferase [Rubricoccaceae bacterium]